MFLCVRALSLFSSAKGKCALVLVADDISERTLKNTAMLCEKSGIDMIKINRDMDMIAKSLGKRSGVLSVTDANFAKRIKELSAES